MSSRLPARCMGMNDDEKQMAHEHHSFPDESVSTT